MKVSTGFIYFLYLNIIKLFHLCGDFQKEKADSMSAFSFERYIKPWEFII